MEAEAALEEMDDADEEERELEETEVPPCHDAWQTLRTIMKACQSAPSGKCAASNELLPRAALYSLKTIVIVLLPSS